MLCARGVHPEVNANLVSVSYFREGKDSCPYTMFADGKLVFYFNLHLLQALYDTHNIAGSVFNSPKLNFFRLLSNGCTYVHSPLISVSIN